MCKYYNVINISVMIEKKPSIIPTALEVPDWWGDKGEERERAKKLFVDMIGRAPESNQEHRESVTLSFGVDGWTGKDAVYLKDSGKYQTPVGYYNEVASNTEAQVAMISAGFGRSPLRISLHVSESDTGGNWPAWPTDGHIRYSDVEKEVLAAAQELDEKFEGMDLIEIGKRLIAKSKSEIYQKRLEQFKEVLTDTPRYCNSGSHGGLQVADKIELTYGSEGPAENEKLAQEGYRPEGGWGPIILTKADTVIVQLIRIIAKRGNPLTIKFSHDEGSGDKLSQIRNSFYSTLKFGDVENAILETARELSPAYKDSSLQEIADAIKNLEQ